MKHLIAASLFCLTSLAQAAPLAANHNVSDGTGAGGSSHQQLNHAHHDPRTIEVVMSAMAKLDIPYRLGGTSRESGFDCSGLVHAVFQQTLGLVLPRRAAEQAASTERIEKSQLRPGDLVFFNTLRRAYSHVGIYIGDNKFIHAPRTGARVRVENMDMNYWRSRFDGARRVSLADASAPPRLSSAFASSSSTPSSNYELTSNTAPDEIALIASRELNTPVNSAASNETLALQASNTPTRTPSSSAALHNQPDPLGHHISVLPSLDATPLQSTSTLAMASLSPSALERSASANTRSHQSLSSEPHPRSAVASPSPTSSATKNTANRQSQSQKPSEAKPKDPKSQAAQKGKSRQDATRTAKDKPSSGKKEAKANPSKRDKSVSAAAKSKGNKRT